MIPVLRLADHEQMSRTAATAIANEIRHKPELSLIVATGNTPLRTYEMLSAMYQEGSLHTDEIGLFQLDEYVAVSPGDPRSLYRWTMESFALPLGITETQVIRLAGNASNLDEACRTYTSAVAKRGGIDLCVVGLGPNGHLGYNEPPSEADAETRVVHLTESSIRTAAHYWNGQFPVPELALTCGMDILLAAKKILLLVSGANKADILRRTLEGPGNPKVPASHLHSVAEKVTIIADGAAFGG